MPIMHAMIKYGFETFEFHTLTETETTEAADRLECSLISSFNPRYNVARGGASTRGKYTQEIRDKISAAIRRRPKHLFRVTPVFCVETGQKFFSIAEASRQLGLGASALRNHLCGLSNSVGGFTFKRCNNGPT